MASRLDQPYRHWSRLVAVTGLCTALLGGGAIGQGRMPGAIAQTTTRNPETFTGRLSTNSPVLEEDGTYYETHTFSGTAGETLTFDLVSDEFDAYLILVSPAGEWVAQDDDGGEGTNARIVLTLPSTGTYTLVVNTYGPGETGAYQLQVRATVATDRALVRAEQLSQQVLNLYQAGRYGEAIPLAMEVLRIDETALGPDHPRVANSLNNLALLYQAQGNYGGAEPLFQRALRIDETALGPDHPDVAASLNNLAELYRLQGNHGAAEPLFQRALRIFETALGPDHPNVATSLNNLALLYQDQGNYGGAEPLFQRALRIRETALGPDHPSVATSLNNLAGLYRVQGNYGDAEPLFRRALRIRETTLGPEHPSVATSLNNLAALYRVQGNYGDAEPLFQRSLRIVETALGSDHPSVATSLGNLALLYSDQGNYGDAEPLFQRALRIRETTLGPEHPLVAASLNNLALLYSDQGNYGDAEPLYQRALRIDEAALGLDHPSVATSLNNLAALYRVQGNYGDAEPLFQRSLRIVETALGPEHPDVATSLNNLAELYRAQGNYGDAEPLYQRALRIDEAALGPNHPDVATSLNNLAALYDAQGNYDAAEPLYQRALRIRETALGSEHPDVATSLNDLAALYSDQGNYDAAEPLYQRALRIWETTLGPEHPSVATSLNNLAALYQVQGNYSDAETLAQRSLRILETALGPEHPLVASSLNNLAALYDAQGNPTEVVGFLARGLAIEEQHLALNLTILSDTRRQAYVTTIVGTTNAAISLNLQSAPADPAATELALTTVLRRKGRILEAGVDSWQRLRQNLAPADQELLDDLTAAQQQLATLLFNPPPNLNRETVTDVTAQVNQLEAELARRSAAFRVETQPVDIAAVQARLPSDGVLIEYVRYQPYDPTASPQERWGEDRYAVYLLFPDGRIEAMDLGAAADIDVAVERLVADLSAGRTAPSEGGTSINEVKQRAQALDALVMAPVRELLGDTTTVFLSPDGSLNLIPFEALVDESGDYLVEQYQFRYLTSGRDLLRLDLNPASGNPALLVGNPTYGRPGELIAQADTRAIDFENRIFPALPGTGREVEAIADQLPDALVYSETNATEAVVKDHPQPNILHIATHGFFEASADSPNPLLQSGLILAGAALAERQSGPDQDGILTALEVTGLDLRGTQLVVLSACETGVGELAAGEGVYGLRRALVLAGSHSQVISLWKVDDAATQELMVAYYDRLLSGMPRDAALRETQLAFLNTTEYRHPYYWAAFIGSGDWRSLALNN
jgi:tetratricopeptide (TPR) repeat protein/CHAT domain-containing protein